MISPPFVTRPKRALPEVVIAFVDDPALVAVGAVAGVEHFLPQRFSPNDVIGRVDKPIVVIVALLGSGGTSHGRPRVVRWCSAVVSDPPVILNRPNESLETVSPPNGGAAAGKYCGAVVLNVSRISRGARKQRRASNCVARLKSVLAVLGGGQSGTVANKSY